MKFANKFIFLFLLFLFNLSAATVAFAEDKLIFVIDVIRHGDRAPEKELPNSRYDWPQGLLQLTDEGMQREFNLGAKMRAKYVDQYHLLPPRYARDTMYVRSTNIDRTLMSAESLLFGLYPLGVGVNTMPSAFQPIPVHTIKKEEDTMLIPDQDKNKYDALQRRYVYNQEAWKQKSAELKNAMLLWSEITGLEVKNLHDLIYLADNLFNREHNHVPMPKGIAQDTAHQIIEAGQWAFVQTLKPYPVGKASAKELFQDIHAHLNKAILPDNKLKFVLYSAHDSTIMMIMSALHVPMEHPPFFASDWNLALYETPAHEYYVKTSLNDEPVVIPACHSDRCPLSKFVQFLQ